MQRKKQTGDAEVEVVMSEYAVFASVFLAESWGRCLAAFFTGVVQEDLTLAFFLGLGGMVCSRRVEVVSLESSTRKNCAGKMQMYMLAVRAVVWRHTDHIDRVEI